MSEKFGPLTEKIQNKVGFSDEKALKLEEGLCSSTDMVTQAMVQLVAKMDGEMIVHNDLKERFAALLSVLDIQALLIEANLTSNPDQGFIHLKKLRTIISKMSDLLVHSKNLGPLTLEKNVFNLQSLFRQVITTCSIFNKK